MAFATQRFLATATNGDATDDADNEAIGLAAGDASGVVSIDPGAPNISGNAISPAIAAAIRITVIRIVGPPYHVADFVPLAR